MRNENFEAYYLLNQGYLWSFLSAEMLRNDKGLINKFIVLYIIKRSDDFSKSMCNMR